jgi:hypothetical protein
MKHLFTILLALATLGLSSSDFAQSKDPGLPDTLRIESTVIPLGVSAPVTISIWNDFPLGVASIQAIISPLDSGFARLDSVCFVGRMADPSVLSVRILNRNKVDYVPPDSFMLGCVKILDLPLPPGDGPVAELYFTGSQVGELILDTGRVNPYYNMFIEFSSTGGLPYVPYFSPTVCEVVPASLPPVLVLPKQVPFAGTVEEAITFTVSANSPLGYPVQVILNGFLNVEESTRTPLRIPQCDEVGQFSWTPAASDVGIWAAKFQAQDSSGATSTAEVEIQVVADGRFLTELTSVETPTSFAATGLAHGDFDRDGAPEIVAPAVALRNDHSFAVFRYEPTGGLNEVTISHEESYNRGIAVGLLDDDEYLDAIYSHDAILRILRGDGVLFGVEDRQQAATPAFRDAALIDFDGDEHLDYVCASLFGVTVHRGGDDARFDDLFWFMTGDSALSVSSADFNQDGFDDLAIGTTAGVKVYLNDKHGSYSEGEFYPQVYGAVDVEVTTRGSDFNNDGLFDLCLATPSVGGTHSELVVYLGLGDGTFQPVLVRTVKGQIFSARPGDFNGDGFLDLAYANGARKYVGIVFGDGAGGFLNERRFPVPKYSPRRMDCLDIDLDGDLDLVIAAYDVGMTVQSALFVYLNQSDPPDVEPVRLEVQAANNVDMQLLTPRGGCLSRVANSTASGELYLADLDDNAQLDMVAISGTVESGRYEIVASPKRNLPTEEPFSLTYTIGTKRFRIAENLPAGQYVFPFYPEGVSAVSPKQGEFILSALPTFTWPSNGTERFELATDIAFSNVIESATVSGGIYTLQIILPANDSTAYFWRIRPESGSSENDIYVFNVVQSPTDVDDGNSDKLLPDHCWLEQNYPNPFNPLTTIRYHLPEGAHVGMTVHNVLGQLIRTLIDQAMPSGDHSVEWDATDQSGRPVASGIYFYRMTAGEASFTRKMTLIR